MSKQKRARQLPPERARQVPNPSNPEEKSSPDARAQEAALAEVQELLVEKLGSDEAQRVLHKVQTVSFSGPLPLPFFVEAYNEAIPDGGHRIMAMAESEQAHHHSMQKIAADIATRDSKTDSMLVVRGQYIGGATILILVVGGVFGLLTERFVAGYSAFAGAIAAYAAGWIGARLSEKKSGRQNEASKQEAPPKREK